MKKEDAVLDVFALFVDDGNCDIVEHRYKAANLRLAIYEAFQFVLQNPTKVADAVEVRIVGTLIPSLSLVENDGSIVEQLEDEKLKRTAADEFDQLVSDAVDAIDDDKTH